MKTRHIPRTLCGLAFLLTVASANAQWQTQQFLLKPGWTAVYLNVDPSHATLSDTVGADGTNPIDEIWMWQPAPATLQFVTDPAAPSGTGDQWARWDRLLGPSSELQRLVGNAAFLVHNSSGSDYLWAVQGKPLLPANDWTSLGITLGAETDPEIAPRIQLVTSPYAYLSRYAQGLTDGEGSSVINLEDQHGLKVSQDLIVRQPGQNHAIRMSPSQNGIGVNPELVIQPAAGTAGNDADFHISLNAIGSPGSFDQNYIDSTQEASQIRFHKDGNLSFRTAPANGSNPIAWNTRLYIKQSNGRVGIGTTSPSAALEVNGTIKATTFDGSFTIRAKNNDAIVFLVEKFDVVNGLEYRADGTFKVNGTSVHPSDRRLKKDIASLPDALDRVLRLRPSEYRWKTDPAGTPKRIGFVAQDVAEVFPDLVDASGDTLALDYNAFGVLAIKAIQEQRERMAEKDAQIAALEARLTDLTASVEDRESGLDRLERHLERLVGGLGANASGHEIASR